jgi:hypothetical protein
LTTSRCYIESEGHDSKALAEGLVWLFKNAKNQRISLAMPNKNILDSDEISLVFGPARIKSLKKFGNAEFGDAKVKLIMPQDKGHDCEDSPILAVYPDRKFLDMLDSIQNVSAILAIPWGKGDVEEWKKIWDVTELRSSVTTRHVQIQDGILREAARTISISVNSSDRLSNPVDRSLVAQVLETVRSAGIEFDPLEIKAYLLNSGDGWNAVNAEEVSRIAKLVKESKLGDCRSDWLEHWKEVAEKKSAE